MTNYTSKQVLALVATSLTNSARADFSATAAMVVFLNSADAEEMKHSDALASLKKAVIDAGFYTLEKGKRIPSPKGKQMIATANGIAESYASAIQPEATAEENIEAICQAMLAKFKGKGGTPSYAAMVKVAVGKKRPGAGGRKTKASTETETETGEAETETPETETETVTVSEAEFMEAAERFLPELSEASLVRLAELVNAEIVKRNQPQEMPKAA